MKHTLKAIRLLPMLALALACAKDAPKPTSTTKPEIVVETKDFAFLAPDSIGDGAFVWRLKNSGPTLHHVQIVRLDSGHTANEAIDALKKMESPAWIHHAGGPSAAEAGQETVSTIALTAGNYLLLCFVDLPDKVPHFAKGMVHPLKVVARATSDPMPAPSADAITLVLNDFSFTGPDTLKAGHHQFAFRNNGKQSHEAVLLRFKPGQTPDSVAKWSVDYKGPAPFTAAGGTAAVSPSDSGLFDAELTPGTYMIVCFVPDPTDGNKPHMMKGMVKIVTVL